MIKFLVPSIFILVFLLAVAPSTLAYTTNMPASVVIGQPNFTSNLPDQDNSGIAKANGLDYPYGVATDGTHLFIADCFNNRVLIYNHIPTANNASADVVIGQPDFTSNLNNQGQTTPSANTLWCPTGVDTDGTKLFISDMNNARVLIYNHIPTINNAPADVEIGQPSLTTIPPTNNQVIATGYQTASDLSFPSGVAYDPASGKLIIDDATHDNRVLIYNKVPTTNGAAADVVVGEPDFTTRIPCSGTLNQVNLCNFGVAKIINGELFEPDPGNWSSTSDNERVMVWNPVPITNGAPASSVLGQPDFLHQGANQSPILGSPNVGNPAANTLFKPFSLASDGVKLFVSDSGNNRILLFNSLPASNDPSANIVLGQPNFNSILNNENGSNFAGSDPGTPSATSLYVPRQIALTSSQLIVADSGNNRVLIYNNNTPQSCSSLQGDINNDGAVNLTDLSIFAADYGKTNPQTFLNTCSDINADGAVNLTDLSLLAKNYGT